MKKSVNSDLKKYQRNVTISKKAFIEMITSSIEEYGNETFGVLVGKKHKKYYLVQDVVTPRTAIKKSTLVSVKKKAMNRIKYSLCYLTDYEVLGDFHSHPGGPDYLSSYDEKAFLKIRNPIIMLITICKTKRSRRWRQNKDLSISGSIGNKYHIRMIAYKKDQKRKRAYPVKMVCKYTRFLNKKKLYKCRYQN